MTYYRRHVFVCENIRANGERCCGASAAAAEIGDPARFLRALLKERKEHGKGRVRVNRAGCLDRCQSGPALVVYPDNVWYRYETEDDLRAIALSHLSRGEVVSRLTLANDDAQSKSKGESGESDKTIAP